MKVELDKRVYSLTAVQETAEQFAGLTETAVTSGRKAITVEFRSFDEELGPRVVDEFLNYALAESISNRG
jgi:hypothetical protein